MTRLSPSMVQKFKSVLCASIVSLGLATAITLNTDRHVQAAETMLVLVDQAQILRLSEPAASIIIGNPMIADATVQDNKMLVITGISYGTTNMIILNEDGREIFSRQLEVRLSSYSQVTVQRGGDRFSYACAPKCEPILAIGDQTEQFEAVRGAIAGRIESATAGSNQSR
ncbi:MAG: pilus assembly protein N-terminal domain-containing protein [Rhizobiales bacterium]|nr:pilus assembly protein N-terminal domain-containing protein [Hyphomicrobiales bacterium]